MDNLLTLNFKNSKTIRIRCTLFSPTKERNEIVFLVYDTGADRTTITKETLDLLGYTDYKTSDIKKRTALGMFIPYQCDISTLIIGGQFKLNSIRVDVMEIESAPMFNGVIGMDFISCVESVISGNSGTLTITSYNL